LITDAGLEFLRKMPLTRLNLEDCVRITDDVGIAYVENTLPESMELIWNPIRHGRRLLMYV
jgi:hypothetical protein